MATETTRQPARTWVRYGGLLAIVAAVLSIVTPFLAVYVLPDGFTPGAMEHRLVSTLVFTYLVLGVVGVGAFYARYGSTLGWLGIAGLGSIAVGAVVGIAAVLGFEFVYGGLLNLVLVFGGAGVLAAALLEIPAVPRAGAYLLGLTPVAVVVGFGVLSVAAASRPVVEFAVLMVAVVTFGAGWIVLGYHLWSESAPEGDDPLSL